MLIQSLTRLGAGACALAMSTLAFAPSAAAQDWPNKPVKIVVTFGAGGTADILARLLTAELSNTFKQQFIVENRAGSSGTTGSAYVVSQPADGYTLMIGGAGPQLVTPAINSTVAYDTMRDFTHIAMVAGDSWMLAAAPASGIKTFADFLERARAAPLNCGSPGTGSQGHLLQEIINRKLGTKLQQVPYRGSGEAMNDLIGGHVPTALQPSIGVGEHVKAKTAVGLAVSTPARLPSYPDVPTFKELGQDIQITSWFWLAGPKDLPAEIVTRLNREIRRIVTLPQIKAQFDTRALSTLDLDPAQTRAHIAEEVALWRSVAKDSGIKVN